MKPTTTFIIIMTLLCGCKQDVIQTYYEDGSIKERYAYTGDSLKHGSYTLFDENGQKVEVAHYNNGKLHGKRELLENSVVIQREHYHQDVFQGKYMEYHPDGTIKMEGEYNDGILKGMVKGYYPSGKLKEEVTFVNNEENGPFKEYHENGNIHWEGTYLNGDKEFGLLRQYNDSGVLVKKMLCDSNAICTTTWTSTDTKDE